METALLLMIMGLSAVIPATQPDSIDACGWFEAYLPDNCLYFHANIGVNCAHFGIALDTLPDSLLDHTVMVRVRGDVTLLENWCGLYYEYVVQDPVITPCEARDLGCGVLDRDEVDHCNTWNSPVYGRLLIGSFQGYSDGDTVRTSGVVDHCTASVCLMTSVWNVTFYACEESPPAVKRETWGALKTLFK